MTAKTRQSASVGATIQQAEAEQRAARAAAMEPQAHLQQMAPGQVAARDAAKPTTTAKAIHVEPATRLRRKVILYGDGGTQKTTAACQFPAVFVIQDAISEGAAHLNVTATSVVSVDDLVAACNSIPDGCDTIVFDDFDLMVDRWARAAEAGCRSFDKRQAYRPLYNKIMPALQSVMLSGRNVVFTCHAKREQELTPGPDGKFRILLRPDLPDELERYLRSVVEVVAYTYNNGRCSALCNENATDVRRIVAKHRVGLNVPDRVAMAEFAQVVMK